MFNYCMLVLELLSAAEIHLIFVRLSSMVFFPNLSFDVIRERSSGRLGLSVDSICYLTHLEELVLIYDLSAEI